MSRLRAQAAAIILATCLCGSELVRAGAVATSSMSAVALARAAIQQALADPTHAADWLRRIRSAAWLPELKVGVDKELGTRETIDPADRARYSSYNLNQLRIDVQLSWRLDRLRFDPDELAASRQAVHLAELRQELALSVIRLYYEWKRLALEAQLDGAVEPKGDPAHASANAKDMHSDFEKASLTTELRQRRLRMAEIAAELGVLCGVELVRKMLDKDGSAR